MRVATNPRLQPAELFEHLATGFKLPVAAAASKTDVVAAPRGPPVAVARRRPQRGIDCGRSAALSDDLIEELRLLANIESDDAKLLPLILAGQPELALRLNEHQLRQFKQRITLRCQLVPFTLQETAAYVFGRVRLAGGDATRLFTRNAVVAIHGASKGIPRGSVSFAITRC